MDWHRKAECAVQLLLLSVCQERPAETNSNVDNSAPPSVAQLAGRFREQAAAAKETPASKPTRRKPPCSLPLFPPRVELGQNGEEKSPPGASHLPKIKVKSSPLIEKLQANLTFDPAALLPGASPKSPGLKAIVSPFHSPPSTPSTPGVGPRAGEVEEVPVSFDQPPEGSHLPCYNKVRTRGSIKRRPPSRRFRRSQSDCGELGEFRAVESSQENGAREENRDEVFTDKSKAPGSPPSSKWGEGEAAGRTLGPAEKPPPRRTSSGTEKPEEQASTPGEAQQGKEAGPNSEDGQGPAQEAPEPPQAASPEGEAGEAVEKAAEVKGKRSGNEEDGPEHKGQDAEEPEEQTVGEEVPQSAPEDVKGSGAPEQEKGQGKPLEPGLGTLPAALETSSEILTDDSDIQETEM